MDEQNKNVKQKNSKLSIWKKYFSGWNLVINALIAFIPASLPMIILKEIGFGGVLMATVLFGFIYLVGISREKANKKYNPKGKKTNSVIISLILCVALWLLVIATVGIIVLLSSEQKSTDENLTLTKMDKEEIIGNLYRNNQYKFRIKFPDGWEIKDGDGQHIIKEATKNGSTILVSVIDFFDGKSLLNELMNEANAEDFSDKEFKEMMSSFSDEILSNYEGAKILDESISYIDNQKAFYVKSEISHKALDIEIQTIMIHYITLCNGNFYMINGAFSKDDFSVIEKQINLSVSSFVFENF